MENDNDWLVSQMPPEYRLGGGVRVANRDRQKVEAQPTVDTVGRDIRRGLAEIALRVKNGGVKIWQDQALCSAGSVDKKIFEPPRNDRKALGIAVRYCDECAVSRNCESFVKGRSGGGMVWAGRRKE